MNRVYWAPLTAFAVALLINWFLTRTRLPAVTLDYPGPRSLHRSPIPRIGGVGIHAGVMLAFGLLATRLPYPLLPTLAILFAVSFLNDLWEIPAGWRLLAHLVVGGIFVVFVLPDAPPVTQGLAVLGIAWMCNLYNFMDGADGLAGGMTVFGFTFYGIACAIAGNEALAAFNVSIAAAAGAFLIFNFHPARMFMGDLGSVPLGFLAAAVGVLGWVFSYWPWWFPPLVFSPFIVDASATLARRLLKGEKVWRPHRDHYYQRLVLLGWGHRKMVLAAYVLMLACGALALAGLDAPAEVQAAILAGAALAYLALIVAISRAWRRHRAASGS